MWKGLPALRGLPEGWSAGPRAAGGPRCAAACPGCRTRGAWRSVHRRRRAGPCGVAERRRLPCHPFFSRVLRPRRTLVATRAGSLCLRRWAPATPWLARTRGPHLVGRGCTPTIMPCEHV
ncbi:hypothetical protein EFN20_00075 [Propionibacterium freudenreichii]|nr:hypothetical protein [Propionibacterium freudenreichii]MCT2976905.1 hypothetical protein [Propionibacterium freudenreichii]MCT2979088.1 hypothetical protein [Propionibacterium freudenreichii]MCT2986580.1 hypothetical protein [Propionibacterium freudenreichii]MCT2990578.1 hypothetical protein [Propionibacterium freudenreichii]